MKMYSKKFLLCSGRLNGELNCHLTVYKLDGSDCSKYPDQFEIIVEFL